MKRYHDRKAMLIARLGGKCNDCGTEEDLEFDHVDPETKSFTITSKMFTALDVLFAEVDKCVLRCKPCHKTRSDLQKSVEHGQGASGKRNCACELCRKQKSEYNRMYKGLL